MFQPFERGGLSHHCDGALGGRHVRQGAAIRRCFAIEFHDIQRQHRLLHGKDVVTSLAIDDSFYRAQIGRAHV